MKLSEKLKRIDYIGNGLLMAGTISMLYALTYAGVKSSWGDWSILVPFCLGFFGLILFAFWESYGTAPEPVMPPRLFRHWTSKVLAVNTFLHWMLAYWGMYFLPIYFQSVLLYTARHTGVSLLPMTILSIPSCAIAATLVSYWGRFKWLLFAGEAVFTLGLGLLSTQNQGSTTAEWATFQCVCAIGAGIVLETLLPGFQAPVDEKDQGRCYFHVGLYPHCRWYLGGCYTRYHFEQPHSSTIVQHFRPFCSGGLSRRWFIRTRIRRFYPPIS